MLNPHSAAGDYELVKRSPLMSSAADHIAFEEYSKPLLCRTKPFLAIRAGAEYAKLHQKGIRSIVLINKLARVTNGRSTHMNFTSHPRTKAELDTTKEASNKKQRSSDTTENVVGLENRHIRTFHNVQRNSYVPQNDTGKPAEHIPHHFLRHIGEG